MEKLNDFLRDLYNSSFCKKTMWNIPGYFCGTGLNADASAIAFVSLWLDVRTCMIWSWQKLMNHLKE